MTLAEWKTGTQKPKNFRTTTTEVITYRNRLLSSVLKLFPCSAGNEDLSASSLR